MDYCELSSISIHQIFLKIILNQHLRNIYLERILKVFKYININLRTDINVKYLLPFSISLITNYIAFTNFSINVPCFPFHVDCNIWQVSFYAPCYILHVDCKYHKYHKAIIIITITRNDKCHFMGLVINCMNL